MKKNQLWLFVVLIFSLSCTPKEPSGSATVFGLIDVNIKGFDPINASDRYSNRMISQVYEGLYNYHYLKRPLQLQPQLAEGMPKISKDGKTYKIKIKKGIYFQDSPAFAKGKGRELIAEDFIYSWKRLADPRNKSQGFWIFDNRIVGLDQWRKQITEKKATYDSPVEGLKATGKYELQVQLKTPFYSFPHLLAMGYTKVVAKEVVEKYGPEFINHPVGTGPYILKEWIRNSSLTFIKNPNFRDEFYPKEGEPEDQSKGFLQDAGRKLPLSDKVIIKEISERQSAWLQFLQGELDHTVISKDSFSSFFANGSLTPEMKKRGVQVYIESRMGFTYEAMNMDNPFFGKNKKVRQAIAHIFNKKALIDTFYNGRAIPAEGPIPPGITGYQENFKNSYTYDLEKAKQLLKEAGFPNGKGLPIFHFELPTSATSIRQKAEYVQQQLKEIGIRTKIIINTWPQFDKKVKLKKADFFSMAWTADYPDGENFLQLFYSKNISPGSNSTNYQNSTYDRMYEQAMILPPGKERTALYHKMSQHILEEVPLIPMVHRINFLPYQSWLKNYKENTVVADFYKYLRVDKTQRERLKKNL